MTARSGSGPLRPLLNYARLQRTPDGSRQTHKTPQERGRRSYYEESESDYEESDSEDECETESEEESEEQTPSTHAVGTRSGTNSLHGFGNAGRQDTRGLPNIVVNVTDCKWKVVRQAILERGWEYVQADPLAQWDIFWSDGERSNIRISGHQKINHFPGMYSIARKNFLGHNLAQMRKEFPSDYDFFPMTWILPDAYESLRADMIRNRGKTYIAKPRNSSQGKGIFLSSNIHNIPKDKPLVVQRYLDEPFLIDNLKFDLRIYVLVTSCMPLRIFLYDEGLARFCTEVYTPPNPENMEDKYVHLTNYAINKTNENFEVNTDPNKADKGSKRSLESVMKAIESMGHDTKKLWSDIGDIIIKTLIAAQPSLEIYYKNAFGSFTDGFSCFEILGFDVMLDKECRPWLLEVNHAPSLRTDSPFDTKVKLSLVSEVLSLIQMDPEEKQKVLKQRQQEIKRRTLGGSSHDLSTIQSSQNVTSPPTPSITLTIDTTRQRSDLEDKTMVHFSRIFPATKVEEIERFEQYLVYARSIPTSLFSETTAFTKRKELQLQEKDKRDAEKKAIAQSSEKFRPNDEKPTMPRQVRATYDAKNPRGVESSPGYIARKIQSVDMHRFRMDYSQKLDYATPNRKSDASTRGTYEPLKVYQYVFPTTEEPSSATDMGKQAWSYGAGSHYGKRYDIGAISQIYLNSSHKKDSRSALQASLLTNGRPNTSTNQRTHHFGEFPS